MEYYRRLELARPTEQEIERFQARQEEAFRLIIEALSAKDISHEFRDGTLWVSLELEGAVA